MSHNEGSQLVFTLLDVLGVWKNVVDAWSITFFRHELETGVNNNHIVFGFDDNHVATNFFYSRNWNNTYGVVINYFW